MLPLRKLKPVRKLKLARSKLVDRWYRTRPAADYVQFMASVAGLKGENVVFCIAYNSSWLIDLMIDCWRAFIDNVALVVVDNSNKARSAAEIKRTCAERGVPYLKLPYNFEWNPSRSHGISINWVFDNIVRKLEPKTFGTIDHDCFPFRRFDLASAIAAAPLYGVRRAPGLKCEAWSLWPGYAFFQYAPLRDLPLDFSTYPEFRMDTGGANWEVLYKSIDSADPQDRVRYAKTGVLELDGLPAQFVSIEDSFVHLGGASYFKQYKSEMLRQDISQALRKRIAASRPE